MTLYQMFGIAENASDAEIDAAWKKLMKAYHPDVNPNVDKRIAQQINQAHDLLKDPEKRAAYDVRLQQSRQPRPFVWANRIAVGSTIAVDINGTYTFYTR